MGQILFLKSGSGAGSAASLQSAYMVGRDIDMVYGPMKLSAVGEGFVSGDAALVIGTDAEQDISLLLLAKVSGGGDSASREPVAAIGNIGGRGPALQTYSYPNPAQGGQLDAETDVTGLSVAFGGPTLAHKTDYGLHGITWSKGRLNEDNTPVPNTAVSALRVSWPGFDTPPFDPESIEEQPATQVSLMRDASHASIARIARVAMNSDTHPGFDGTIRRFTIEHGLMAFPVVVQVYRRAASDLGWIAELEPVAVRIRNQHAVEVEFGEDRAPTANDAFTVMVVGS